MGVHMGGRVEIKRGSCGVICGVTWGSYGGHSNLQRTCSACRHEGSHGWSRGGHVGITHTKGHMGGSTIRGAGGTHLVAQVGEALNEAEEVGGEQDHQLARRVRAHLPYE
eukprot:7278577-Prymnesium_polylepis.1